MCVCFPAMTLGGTVDVLATEDPDAVAQEDEELQVYEKHNNLLHGSKKKRWRITRIPKSFVKGKSETRSFAWLLSDSIFREKIVSKEFMRKYIHIAKAVTPVLTEEAANHIAEEYARLRSQEQMGADIARVRTSDSQRVLNGCKGFRPVFWLQRSSVKYSAWFDVLYVGKCWTYC